MIEQKHQENLDFIAKSLINKPYTAELMSKIIKFNGSSYAQVKVVFPTEIVPFDEFETELAKNKIDLL